MLWLGGVCLEGNSALPRFWLIGGGMVYLKIILIYVHFRSLTVDNLKSDCHKCFE